MTYRIRVSLPGIKGFARVYEVNGRNTLYHLHKQMVADMEFPPDQVVLFKALDAAGNTVARYATFSLGDGSIEQITIEQVVKKEITGFTYFYDTINKRSVDLTIEGSVPGDASSVVLVESKGPVPEAFLNGYVAFEDLPADKRRKLENPDEDDFDDEDEDSQEEDDETEEIYGTDEDE